jgi:hypothetical protein
MSVTLEEENKRESTKYRDPQKGSCDVTQ